MRSALRTAAAVAIVGLAGCDFGSSSSTSPTPSPAAQVSGTAQVSGSSAMKDLVNAAKEKFEAKNPNATINITISSSSQGLSQLVSGAAEIGDSDIPATTVSGLQAADQLVDHQVAVVPFAIIVHPSVNVTNLTTKNLQDIFSGTVTNWKDVGGQDLGINVFIRPKTSGTRATFKKTILGSVEELGADKQAGIADTSTLAITDVKGPAGSRVYGGISYVALGQVKADSGVKAVKLDDIEAGSSNVINGKYKFWSHEHMYTKKDASAVAKAFVDFVLSSEFQDSTELTAAGFIPVAKVKSQSAADVG